jgi:aminoglycoside phosphotransferase (APT) family kinase protein
MDEAACRAALLGLESPRRPKQVARIEGGWSFWTFEADGEIVRFPRMSEDARRLEAEFRLLPVLAERLPVAVPSYAARGQWDGAPFGVYPRLPGHEVAADELLADDAKRAAELGRALRALHGVSIDAYTGALGEDGTADGWWSRKLRFFDDCLERAFPLLPGPVRAAAEREIAMMSVRVEAGMIAPVLAHNDLGLVHVLTDGTRLTGIIDWSDAEMTDPAIDFVGVLGAGGVTAVEAVLRGYGQPPGEAFWERLWFLAWVSPLHDIMYGLDTGQEGILADGVAGVEVRMRSGGVL